MLSELYCFVDCFVAMQQLLCRHAAIALSPCSNGPYLYNRTESAAASRYAAAGWRYVKAYGGLPKVSKRRQTTDGGVNPR